MIRGLGVGVDGGKSVIRVFSRWKRQMGITARLYSSSKSEEYKQRTFHTAPIPGTSTRHHSQHLQPRSIPSTLIPAPFPAPSSQHHSQHPHPTTIPSTFIPAPSLACPLYTSPSPRDRTRSRMPSSASTKKQHRNYNTLSFHHRLHPKPLVTSHLHNT